MTPTLYFIPLADPLPPISIPGAPRLPGLIHAQHAAFKQNGNHQLHHASVSEFQAACQWLETTTRSLMSKYQYYHDIVVVVVPVKSDSRFDIYDGMSGESATEYGVEYIRIEWSHDREDRAQATITHEFAHALRRQYDDADEAEFALLTHQILHEGLAESLVEAECGPDMVLHNGPLTSTQWNEIAELVECEAQEIDLTDAQETSRTALLEGDEKYAFGYHLVSYLLKNHISTYDDLVKMDLPAFATLAATHKASCALTVVQYQDDRLGHAND